MKQYHLFYSGHVQGVGFRYTTARIARNYRVLGWVRNCQDGRVEMMVEGLEEEIARFLEDVESHFEGYISSRDVEIGEATDEFGEFKIKS